MEIKFGEEKRFYKNRRRQYRAKQLLPQGEARVLDCGAGLGEFSDYMANECGYDIACVDGNDAFMDETRTRGYESYAVDLENEPLPFRDNSFDGVVSLEVIEHLWNTDRYLSEIKRVLKPNGWLVISTPNYAFWRRRARHLVGRIDGGTTTRHKRFFTFRSLLETLLDAGFEISAYMVVGQLPLVPKNIPSRILPNLFGETSIIRCMKKK